MLAKSRIETNLQLSQPRSQSDLCILVYLLQIILSRRMFAYVQVGLLLAQVELFLYNKVRFR